MTEERGEGVTEGRDEDRQRRGGRARETWGGRKCRKEGEKYLIN